MDPNPVNVWTNFAADVGLAFVQGEFELQAPALEIAGFEPVDVEEFLKIWWQ